MEQPDIRAFERGWAEEMIRYWQERIDRLGVYRTGWLRRSFAQHVAQGTASATIEHRFALYGIYVAAGTGNGYRRGNGGDLGFRPKRKRRDWYATKYIASVRKLDEVEAGYYGGAYMGTLAEGIIQMFARL